ncbi:MAG: hypothetical protein WDM71_04035 [Ferruginibacter sp.]
MIKQKTPLTAQLSKEGIHIHYEDNLEFIDKDVQVVVFTPGCAERSQRAERIICKTITLL